MIWKTYFLIHPQPQLPFMQASLVVQFPPLHEEEFGHTRFVLLSIADADCGELSEYPIVMPTSAKIMTITYLPMDLENVFIVKKWEIN